MNETRIVAPARLEFGNDFAEDEMQDLTPKQVNFGFHLPALNDSAQ